VNSGIEFHDSVVASVREADGSVEVVFSPGYVHISSGVPGVHPGEGHLQSVLFRFSEPHITSARPLVVGRVSDGFLHVNHERLSLVAFPFAASGLVKLSLVFVTADTLEVVASSVAVSAAGPSTYVERFTG
jgi:hypothetical protein